MANVNEIFTPEAEARIRSAVDRAEEGTSGEIVPYVVAASDSYDGALWKGAAFGALGFSLLAAAVWTYLEPWGPSVPLWVATPPLVGGSFGYLLSGALPALRRALIGSEVIAGRVRRRATVAFVDEEVFRTRERTGILLFLSLFERQVVILGDEGVERKVGPGEWQHLVDMLSVGIKEGRAVEALVNAIEQCGEILHRKGVEIRDDDVDELSDELRSRER